MHRSRGAFLYRIGIPSAKAASPSYLLFTLLTLFTLFTQKPCIKVAVYPTGAGVPWGRPLRRLPSSVTPMIAFLREPLNILRAVRAEQARWREDFSSARPAGAKQKIARRVYPLRRIFVTISEQSSGGKDSVDSPCGEFLEAPLSSLAFQEPFLQERFLAAGGTLSYSKIDSPNSLRRSSHPPSARFPSDSSGRPSPSGGSQCP